MSLPDTAEYWQDIRESFQRKLFNIKPRTERRPAKILHNGKEIHQTNSVYQARMWLRKKMRQDHKNPPGVTDTWIIRAAREGYAIQPIERPQP